MFEIDQFYNEYMAFAIYLAIWYVPDFLKCTPSRGIPPRKIKKIVWNGCF